jgi:hypothetical protein
LAILLKSVVPGELVKIVHKSRPKLLGGEKADLLYLSQSALMQQSEKSPYAEEAFASE